jgi:biotin operon repressor
MKTAWLRDGRGVQQVGIISEAELAHGQKAVKVQPFHRPPIYVHSETLLMERPLSARGKAQFQRAEKVLALLSDQWISVQDIAAKLNLWQGGVWQTCDSLRRDGKLEMQRVDKQWRVRKTI